MHPLFQVFSATALAFTLSWVTSEAIRRHAVRLGLVQTPNVRSSHSIPTPSGGGVGIALASTVCGLILGSELLVPVLVSAAASLLGSLDDRMDLSPRLRLGLHFVFVGALLWALGSPPTLATPFGELPPWVLAAVLLVGGVWWINLYNFMDGIDGLAASQAIFMGVSVITLSHLTAPAALHTNAGLVWALAISSASAGFLALNWPPARLFMGDSGSNFLATALFAVLVGLLNRGELDATVLLILAALFMTDATVTLIGRLRTGNSGFSAHRLHAYQKLSRQRGGHRSATLIYVAINVCWLYPLAYLAQMNIEIAWWLAALAYVPLVVFCLVARAGLPERSPVAGKTHDE